MKPIFRTLTRCLVCGFGEVRTDEVVDRGVVFLAECPRCQHRWTSSEPIERPLAPVARVRSPLRAERETTASAA